MAIVLAFSGLRWEEAVAVPVSRVNLDGQSMIIHRTATDRRANDLAQVGRTAVKLGGPERT